MTGCFIGLFAYTSQQTTVVKATPTIRVQAVCTLHMGRRLSVSCQPDVSTADCRHLPKQKCPVKKINTVKKMTLPTEQASLVQSLLATPQNAVIILSVPTRGKAKIKQIQIKGQILSAF